MGDAILRIPRDARVRAYRTRDTYDGVVPATSKRQPYCHSSYIELSGHVKRVDHGDVFDALLFREETLTRHYFILKFDFSWGIRTNMGKTEGIFLNLQ